MIDKEIKERVNSYNAIIGKSFRTYRIKMGYTQEKVAEMAEISPEYLCKFENGLYNASIYNIINLCKIVEITPNQLLSEFFKDSVLPDNIALELNKLDIEDQKSVFSIVKQLNKNK